MKRDQYNPFALQYAPTRRAFHIPDVRLFIDVARDVLHREIPLIDISTKPNAHYYAVGPARFHINPDWPPSRKWDSLRQSIAITTGSVALDRLFREFIASKPLAITDIQLAARYQEFCDRKRGKR